MSASVVTVGFYDGVHRGHRQLIDEALARAAALGEQCAVVTFDRHPAAVLHPEFAPRLLTAVDHKLELLESCGVDAVHLVHFDLVRAEESAEDFVETVLLGELGARVVVVGENFRFGHARRGDLELLRTLGREHGFEAVGVPLVIDPVAHEPIASSRIRKLIASGALGEAALLLGRPHEVRGFVTNAPGRHRAPVGLVVDTELLLPPSGVYPVRVRVGEVAREATAEIFGELVALEPFAGAEAMGIHPGVRVSLAFA